jgi:hypothetical protein
MKNSRCATAVPSARKKSFDYREKVCVASCCPWRSYWWRCRWKRKKSKKRDQYKITAEELAEYGDANMGEVIPKARPNFLMFNAGGGAGLGEQTISGVAAPLLVYVGTQNQGDTSVLRFYRASDVKYATSSRETHCPRRRRETRP